MCSLIVAWRVFEGVPVVAAANRDEGVERPSAPPSRWDDYPRIVAPRDEEAGGTWLGFNDAGVFVAITNRWVDLEGERSRGLLVRDALEEPSAEAALEAVRTLIEREAYAGFNLVIADRETGHYIEWDGELEVESLDLGLTVVVNEGRDAEAEKAGAIKAALPSLPAVSEEGPADGLADAREWLRSVEPVLADHDLEACVHGDGFGTRSASLIALPVDGDPVYRFADGPPCEAEFEPVEGQL